MKRKEGSQAEGKKNIIRLDENWLMTTEVIFFCQTEIYSCTYNFTVSRL